jgi:hypothetical protein
LKPADLHTPWRFAATPTKTQRLGAAVAVRAKFAGIRFPSDAAQDRGFLGYNVVFFQKAVISPASVVVFDDAKREVARWP